MESSSCESVRSVVVLSVLSIDRSIGINRTKIPKIPKRNGMYVCIYAVVAAAAIIIVIVLLLGGLSRRRGVRGFGVRVGCLIPKCVCIYTLDIDINNNNKFLFLLISTKRDGTPINWVCFV